MNYIAIPGLKFTKKGQLPMDLKFIDSKTIMRRIEEHFKINYDKLKNKSRRREYCFPRQVAMYLLSKNTPLTLAAIGVIFNRDHSSVIHSVRSIEDAIATDERIRNEINGIIDSL